MLRKPYLYSRVIELRKRGLSFNEIRNNIEVAKSTLFHWCKDIPLTTKQKLRFLENRRNTPLIRNKIKEARAVQRKANKWAERLVNNFSIDRKTLSVAGILLYWAEGGRSLLHRSIEFTNTDSRIIKIMLSFFRQILQIPDYKLKIMVRLGREGDIEKAVQYWLSITDIPKSNFLRPERINLSKDSNSLKKYPHGMCRIVVNDTLYFRTMLAMIDQFAKKFIAPVA